MRGEKADLSPAVHAGVVERYGRCAMHGGSGTEGTAALVVGYVTESVVNACVDDDVDDDDEPSRWQLRSCSMA